MTRIDLTTLSCRYVPCHPRSDGLGFADVTWQGVDWEGTPTVQRPPMPILLQRGMLVHMQHQAWLRALPLETVERVMQAIFEAYDAAMRQEGERHAAP